MLNIMVAPFRFNRSIRIGSLRDRITGDSGALTGRELLGRSRVARFLAERLPDKREARRIRHSQRRLARTLLLLAGWRLKAMGGWRCLKTLVIDVDSLPVEVHGKQPGSAWNGYYRPCVSHPIVAAAGETGDILDLRLREGQVHTADGGLEFVLEVLERAERHLCGNAVVQVVVERPGELIPRCFRLLTSIPAGEMSGEDLLALYRKRGKAEGHLGELMSVVSPALSSTSRRKSHYRGKEIRKREEGVDAFACNQVRLLLAGFGYRIMHVQRALLERVTRHRLEPAAPRRPCASHPGALYRLGPPDHDDHRRRVGALAHARPRTRDPARALRIARSPPSTEPFPGSGGRKDAGVSPSVGNRLGPVEKLLLPDSKRLFLVSNRPDLPSGVARGTSAPHPTPDTSVHE